MNKYLFFDDRDLFQIENLTRHTGIAEIVPGSVFRDDRYNLNFSSGWVFRLADKKYRMLYVGREGNGKFHLLSACGDDGIHFEPEDTRSILNLTDRTADNEVFAFGEADIGLIIEDTTGSPCERYKMLFCQHDKTSLYVHGKLFVSPDLLHWACGRSAEWNNGCEPIVSAFRNEKRNCFTIVMRPDWGIRTVGIKETTDWSYYSDYQPCLQCDCLDQPLDELYGMPCFPYCGRYIGLPLIYRGFDKGNFHKYNGGTIEAFLAYSDDGRYWMRSLRNPIISGNDPETVKTAGTRLPLVWPSTFGKAGNGDILIYGTASEKEHGPAFDSKNGGIFCVWRIRKDGFVYLETEAGTVGKLSTREMLWHGGEAHLNLKVYRATVAVYETVGDFFSTTLTEIDGLGHNSCIPFSGDSVDWVPEWESGRVLSELEGHTLVLEVRIHGGSIYSLSGDCSPMFKVDAARVRMAKRSSDQCSLKK